MAVTVKQERFVRELPTSKSATEAAIKAGYSPILLHTNVTKLLQNTTIKKELASLRKEAQTNTILTVTETAELLSDIAKNSDKKRTNPVEAVKELNHMLGRYPPIQHQVASKVLIEVVYVDKKALAPVIEGQAIELIEGAKENEIGLG